MRVISSLAKWIFRKLAPTIFSSADYLEKLQAEEKKKRIQDQLLSCGTGVKFNGEVAITHPETQDTSQYNCSNSGKDESLPGSL